MLALTLPTLIQDGMFMDAMLYTSVSHNLSKGIGTFWFPQFSLHNVAGLPSFHEQPPLVFWIQSLFFRLLGDSLYVERFYTFLCLILSAWLITLIWKQVFQKNPVLIPTAWISLVFWIIIPVCFWSYSNNMHENSMGIFTLLSVLFALKAMHSNQNIIPLLLISGLAIFLAALSKGLPGLFPAFLPALYKLSTGRISNRKALWSCLVLITVPVGLIGLLLCFPDSRESLSIYFFKRVLHRINEVPTVGNRFYIIGQLFMELIPALLLLILVLGLSREKVKSISTEKTFRDALFFILLGLSASLPLMLTHVQKGFYLVPALPYFAIGFALLCAERINSSIHKLKGRTHGLRLTLSLMLLALVLVLSYSRKGRFSRNADMLHDVYLIGMHIPEHAVISVPEEMWNEWDLQCYLMRYFFISLDPAPGRPYLLVNKALHRDQAADYETMPFKGIQYDLYKRK